MLMLKLLFLVLVFVMMAHAQCGGLDLGDVAVLLVERTENKPAKLSA